MSLDECYDHALTRLTEAGGDLDALPLPLQTLLIVESAQGIIDSGGLEFFYEADFPGNPPYSAFVEAYRLIGAEPAARCIEATAAMFPFEEPHLFQELRELWLDKLRWLPGSEFARMSAQVAGDASVWRKLADYVERNSPAFAPGERVSPVASRR